ncbi:hypothetical protein BKN14_03335 [Candidatus Gracilibacteria bacterium HOT-871]|nr:hypothetical protein BKN14_03335 [Candidatus Gracilibacteria bacterium HOT-871]
MLNLSLGLGLEGQGAGGEFSLKGKNVTDDNFIIQNKAEIIKYLNKKKNSYNEIGAYELSETKDYNELVKLANILGFTGKIQFKADDLIRKLEEFGNARGQAITLTSVETQDLKTNVESTKKTKSKNPDNFYDGMNYKNSTSAEKDKLFNNVSTSSNKLDYSKTIGVENEKLSIIYTFDETKDKGNKQKVKKLQAELGVKVDGIFGKNTRNALRKATASDGSESTLSTGKEAIKNSQFTGNSSETLLFEDKQYSQVEASRQVEKTGQAMSELQARIETTKALNGNLSGFFYADKEGYHIKRLLTSLFGKDKYSKIEAFKNSEASKLAGNKDKLERAIGFLRNYSSGRSIKDREEAQSMGKDALGHVMKALPWLAGIYLFDIPLPFWKEMIPGADVNKSVMFNQWIESGMNQEFEEYYGEHKKDMLNPLGEQATLKGVLSQTNLSNAEQARILRGDLSKLDQKTENLLLSYVENLLIPNLEVLNHESFNAFERGSLFTLGGLFGLFKDGKYDKINDIINGLKEAVARKDLENSASVSEAFRLLGEEGDVNPTILERAEAGDKYMNEISGQNKDIQNKFGGLLELGDKKFNDYNRILALVDLNNLYSMMGVSENTPKDKQALDSLIKILNTVPLNGQALSAWEKANPKTYDFIKSLGSEKDMLEYRLSTLPKGFKLKKVNVGESKHGIDLSKKGKYIDLAKIGNDNEAALAAAEYLSPDGKMSMLGHAYKSFLEKGGVTGISYEDFRKAFFNKQTVPITPDLVNKGNIINTGRKTGQGKVTSFGELQSKFGDKEVFKLSPIQKTYSFYENGQVVTVTANYDLYLRTNCTNPLIVPGTIDVRKNGVPMPEGELISLTQVVGRLPIVIPWFLFGRSKPPKTPHDTPKPPPNVPPPNVPPPNVPPPNVPPPVPTPPPTSQLITTPGHTAVGRVADSALQGTATGPLERAFQSLGEL